MSTPPVPPGYERLYLAGAEVVARSILASAIAAALEEGSLYDYAAHHPAARSLIGRGMVYAVPLPGGGPAVVVRRSRHGGLFARLTGERFMGRTRAPHELDVALHLGRLGIPTPEVLAYALYPAAGAGHRADVVTAEITGGADLATRLIDADEEATRRALLDIAGSLLARMAAAGVRHPDLNLRNVLIAPDVNGDDEAWLLDVDRVWFDTPGAARVATANVRRLARSARKWRRLHGLRVADADLARLASAVGAQPTDA